MIPLVYGHTIESLESDTAEKPTSSLTDRWSILPSTKSFVYGCTAVYSVRFINRAMELFYGMLILLTAFPGVCHR